MVCNHAHSNEIGNTLFTLKMANKPINSDSQKLRSFVATLLVAGYEPALYGIGT
jgi:hypothetical protein